MADRILAADMSQTQPFPTPNPSRRLKPRKVLLIGRSGAGKSSMRTIVFSNYIARDVRRLGATIDVEHSNIRFLGNLFLNLWDCGGQDAFFDSYLAPAAAGGQRESVFGNVAVLIYVFDVESREFMGDVGGFERVCQALWEGSGAGAKTGKGKAEAEPRVFVLVHKMDLVNPGLRERLFGERCEAIRARAGPYAAHVDFFATSIWDQSLYKAWTQIIYSLIPNAVAIEELLRGVGDRIGARELVLYERTTCLVVTQASSREELGNPFFDRFERLSSVLKTHKQSIAKHTKSQPSSAHFRDFELRTSRFCWFVTRLTENTNVAVVLPPGEDGFTKARREIDAVRGKFIELDVGGGGSLGKERMGQERFLESAARELRSPLDEP